MNVRSRNPLSMRDSAAGGGFEPTESLHPQRFSRPPRSTAPEPRPGESLAFVADTLRAAVGAQHLRDLAAEVLQDRERHPVDDGGSVQGVHGLGPALAAPAGPE